MVTRRSSSVCLSWPRVRSRSWVGTGTKGLGFALYDPATETYEASGLPGQPFGSVRQSPAGGGAEADDVTALGRVRRTGTSTKAVPSPA